MERKTKTYKSLVARINRHIKENSWSDTSLGRWYVGITNNPARRGAEHQREYIGGVNCYVVFYAHTKKIASQVEDYFSKKGCANAAGSRGATDDSRWVYVYKMPLA